MSNQTYYEKELRAFYDLCERMEADRNRGWYTGDMCFHGGVHSQRFIKDRKFLPYRKGIIFYSTGWGWRLRKGWRETFGQRFYETVVNWEGVNFVKRDES